MAGILKSFIKFTFILLAIWVVFITLVIILKGKISRKIKNIDDFQDKYKDLNDVILRKKREAKENSSKKHT